MRPSAPWDSRFPLPQASECQKNAWEITISFCYLQDEITRGFQKEKVLEMWLCDTSPGTSFRVAVFTWVWTPHAWKCWSEGHRQALFMAKECSFLFIFWHLFIYCVCAWDLWKSVLSFLVWVLRLTFRPSGLVARIPNCEPSHWASLFVSYVTWEPRGSP